MAKRMFVAVDLPDDVGETLAGMDPHVQGLRWLPATQLHLTLCFLAAVPEENELRLIDALTRIEVPRFSLSLKGLGAFGRRGAPSVVWAGAVDEGPELQRLQRRVRQAAVAAGLRVERKRFRPHVTVGRCKGVSAEELDGFLLEHKDQKIATFETNGYTLYESVLRPEGAEHKHVGRWESHLRRRKS
jgi:2'-5' RNA ligase